MENPLQDRRTKLPEDHLTSNVKRKAREVLKVCKGMSPGQMTEVFKMAEYLSLHECRIILPDETYGENWKGEGYPLSDLE